MKIELNREEICRLLRSIDPPSYSCIDKLEKLGLGVYIGGFGDHWEWNVNMDSMPYSEEQLYDIYIKVVNDSL